MGSDGANSNAFYRREFKHSSMHRTFLWTSHGLKVKKSVFVRIISVYLNQSYVQRDVPTEEAREFAREHGLHFCEASGEIYLK